MKCGKKVENDLIFGNTVSRNVTIFNEYLEWSWNHGITRQTRYEVLFLPPRVEEEQKRTNKCMAEWQICRDKLRENMLKCDQIECGRNMDTAPDNNICNQLESCSRVVFCDITAQFQLSSDLKERRFFEAWKDCLSIQTHGTWDTMTIILEQCKYSN